MFSWLTGGQKEPGVPRELFLRGNGRYDFLLVGEDRFQESLLAIYDGWVPDVRYCTALLIMETSRTLDQSPVVVQIYGRTVAYLPQVDIPNFSRFIQHLGHELAPDAVRCRAMVARDKLEGQLEQETLRVRLDLKLP